MSAKKNRDLAQELVDFLQKDEEQKTKILEQARVKKAIPKPALVQQSEAAAAAEAASGAAASIPKAPVIPPVTPSASPVSPPVSSAVPVTISPLPAEALAKPEKTEQKTYVIGESTLDHVEMPSEMAKALAGEAPAAKSKVLSEETPKRELSVETIDFSIPMGDVGSTIAVNGPGHALGHNISSKDFRGAHDLTQKTAEALTGLGAQMPEPKRVEPKSTPKGSGSNPDYNSQRSKVIFNEVSSLMAGVEAVKVAQARINVLENEKTRLRDEIDELLLASESLQRQLNELKGEYDSLERRHKEKIEILEDEKAVLRTRSQAKEDALEKLKKENEELKMRFQTDLRRIRVRERELETRQEIMKSENISVLRAKDDLIIELKRQLEKLHFELDNFRAQSADLNSKVGEFHDRNHRTVKALRLALSVLEAGDGDEKKKTGG